jgi:hypothetical protein
MTANEKRFITTLPFRLRDFSHLRHHKSRKFESEPVSCEAEDFIRAARDATGYFKSQISNLEFSGSLGYSANRRQDTGVEAQSIAAAGKNVSAPHPAK